MSTEISKYRNEDAYKHRGRFFIVGLVIAIGIVILAFSWKKVKKDIPQSLLNQDFIEEQVVVIQQLEQIEQNEPEPEPEEEPEIQEEKPELNDESENIVEEQPEEEKPKPKPDSAVAKEKPKPQPEIYTATADELLKNRMPEPVMGWAKFNNYIISNTNYPAKARQNKKQGSVIVSMVVTKEGMIKEVRVMKGLGMGLDEEAQRLLNQSPLWKPAVKDGKLVDFRIRYDLSFRI